MDSARSVKSARNNTSNLNFARMNKVLLKIILLFCFSTGVAQQSPMLFSPSYRLYPSNVNQTEVFMTQSPLNENILFSSCNTLSFIPFFVSEGIYVTTDGGQNWTGSDTCQGDPIGFHGGDPGIAIDKNGRFILTRIGRSPFVGLYSHYSNDNGKTWSAQKVISTDDLERATIASDANPFSPFYGRTYAAWVKFAPPFPLMLSYSDDGAQNWTEPLQINDPPNRSAGGDITIGPDGEVYVCWAGVTEVSPFKEIYCGFAVSYDGGQNWTVTENAFPMNGITGILVNKANIRVNGLPNIAVDTTAGPGRGNIYIVTGEKDLIPAGSDPDIVFHRSTDGGLNWSAGIRVNQDPASNGKTQYFPGIDIDKTGAVNIIFYDDRNTTNDSAGVYLARSRDGGNSWSEYELSDHNFRPAPIGGLGQGYQGDNIDILSTSTKLWPVWMDNSTGIYQVWTAPVDISSLSGAGQLAAGSWQSAVKVYPNPFSTSTTISYFLTERSHVSLKIYDMIGNEIAMLVDEVQPAGSYEKIFQVSGSGFRENANCGLQTAHSPGIYIAALLIEATHSSGGHVSCKKIILK